MTVLTTIIDKAWDILFEDILKETFSHITEFAKNEKRTLELDQNFFSKSLHQNLTKTINWANNIFFSGLIKDKWTEEKYVELDFFLIPLRETYNFPQKQKNLLNNIFSHTTKHIIILGAGGSGKTTSMQVLTKKLLSDSSFTNYTFPLVIRFREYNSSFLNAHSLQSVFSNSPLFRILYQELGLPLKEEKKNSKDDFNDERYKKAKSSEESFFKKYVIEALNSLKLVLILDGFDEIDESFREKVYTDINELCLGLESSRLIVTSRIGEFNYTISNAHKFQLASFDDAKILMFCEKWLGEKQQGLNLFKEIKNSPFYDTTIRPINLTLLATLYEANGSLPQIPRSVYKQIIDLLLYKWDKIDRNINRATIHSNFDHNEKYVFLCYLAFYLSISNKIIFDIDDLKHIYFKFILPHFNYLEGHDFKDVMNEIELHSGLFVQISTNEFEFPHKSIQEFLTAEVIQRYQPLLEIRKYLTRLPNELAIATSLSKNKEYMLNLAYEFLNSTNDIHINQNFIIYLQKLVIEKVDFIPTQSLGVFVINLWINHFSQQLSFKDVYHEFLNLRGIKESCNLVNSPNSKKNSNFIESIIENIFDISRLTKWNNF